MIKTNGQLATFYRNVAEFLEKHPDKMSYKQVPVLEHPHELMAAGIMLLYVSDLFRDSDKESYLRLEVVKKIEEVLKDPKIFLDDIGEQLIARRKEMAERKGIKGETY